MQDEVTACRDRARELLSSAEWLGSDVTRWEGNINRIRLIEASGLPPMKVLPGRTLKRLKRLPHSSEGLAIPATSLKPGSVVVFFSHPWLRPLEQQPDDEANSKALQLIEFLGDTLSFCHVWVDFACVDQAAPAMEIAALPIYVAASNTIVVFDSSRVNYESRAWCLVERAMAYAFMEFGDEQAMILDAQDEEAVPRPEVLRILNPKSGNVTNEADWPLIENLMEVVTSPALRREAAQVGSLRDGSQLRPVQFRTDTCKVALDNGAVRALHEWFAEFNIKNRRRKDGRRPDGDPDNSDEDEEDDIVEGGCFRIVVDSDDEGYDEDELGADEENEEAEEEDCGDEEEDRGDGEARTALEDEGDVAAASAAATGLCAMVMGALGCIEVAVDSPEVLLTRRLERDMKRDFESARMQVQVIILGPRRSGKSTVVRGLEMLDGGRRSMSAMERRQLETRPKPAVADVSVTTVFREGVKYQFVEIEAPLSQAIMVQHFNTPSSVLLCFSLDLEPFGATDSTEAWTEWVVRVANYVELYGGYLAKLKKRKGKIGLIVLLTGKDKVAKQIAERPNSLPEELRFRKGVQLPKDVDMDKLSDKVMEYAKTQVSRLLGEHTKNELYFSFVCTGEVQEVADKIFSANKDIVLRDQLMIGGFLE